MERMCGSERGLRKVKGNVSVKRFSCDVRGGGGEMCLVVDVICEEGEMVFVMVAGE